MMKRGGSPGLWHSRLLVALAICGGGVFSGAARSFAGAEIDGWGDFRGIRVEGELARFTTSLRATLTNGQTALTATEMVKNPKWKREGAVQTSTGTILFENGQSLHFQVTVEDIANNTARVSVDATADADLTLAGIDYCINLPAADYSAGNGEALYSEADGKISGVSLDPSVKNRPLLEMKTSALHLGSVRRQLDVTLDSASSFTVRNEQFFDTDIATQGGLRIPRDPAGDALVTVRFPISAGNLASGQTVHVGFTLKAGGELDRKPIRLTLDTAHPGPVFDGIGGNFRVYGNEDIASSEYNLTNLRVPLGRVAMPLSAWQPSEGADAVALLAQNGRGARDVEQCIAAAKMVAAHGVPLIVTTWNMPGWALLAPGPGIPGRPFIIPARRPRLEKLPAVYDAMVSYLKYLKTHEGVEAAYFSINEADLGIDILQTPEEHAEFIKEVGARLVAAGLKTKLLLGDACSPHPVKFIEAAMQDPGVLQYVGAVSFHSWHDGTDAEFTAWGDAAKKLKLPLFVGEGGTDADSYRYPAIFLEPWYGLYEADTYVRICACAAPCDFALANDGELLAARGRRAIGTTAFSRTSLLHHEAARRRTAWRCGHSHHIGQPDGVRVRFPGAESLRRAGRQQWSCAAMPPSAASPRTPRISAPMSRMLITACRNFRRSL